MWSASVWVNPGAQDTFRYHLGLFAEHKNRTAPEGADTSSWRH